MTLYRTSRPCCNLHQDALLVINTLKPPSKEIFQTTYPELLAEVGSGKQYGTVKVFNPEKGRVCSGVQYRGLSDFKTIREFRGRQGLGFRASRTIREFRGRTSGRS